MTTRYLVLAALAAVGGAVSTQPVSAMPVDALSCHELWVARNQIYKDNGYCFKTKKARNYFGNGGCYVNDEGDVQMSWKERKLVMEYHHWEMVNGC